MKLKVQKIVGASALGAISIVELLHLQSANATPVTFTGSTFSNPRGGSVEVQIVVDGVGGIYKITAISTPVQPGGRNSSYSSYAIPTLTSEALAAQSSIINGVSGASQISAAWQSSLASAIAAAAAAGETIGKASGVTAPTPTPTVSISPSNSPTPTRSPLPTIAPTTNPGPAGLVVPSFSPLVFKPFAVGSVPDLNSYATQLTSILAQLSQGGGDDNGGGAGIRNSLTALQAQILSEESKYAAMPTTLSAYVALLNQEFASLIAQANTRMANYYHDVQVAAEKLYSAAAKSGATPAPTVRVRATSHPIASLPPLILKPGGLIRKTITCAKTVAGKTTTTLVTGFIVQCPTGFKLVKK